MHTLSRRDLLGSLTAMALIAPGSPARGSGAPFRLGLTPVFLDNEAEVVNQLRGALQTATGRPIALAQRRTYQEVTGLLLQGSIDAAWLCGYPRASAQSKRGRGAKKVIGAFARPLRARS